MSVQCMIYVYDCIVHKLVESAHVVAKVAEFGSIFASMSRMDKKTEMILYVGIRVFVCRKGCSRVSSILRRKSRGQAMVSIII